MCFVFFDLEIEEKEEEGEAAREDIVCSIKVEQFGKGRTPLLITSVYKIPLFTFPLKLEACDHSPLVRKCTH
jgi:hypothetical protein